MEELNQSDQPAYGRIYSIHSEAEVCILVPGTYPSTYECNTSRYLVHVYITSSPLLIRRSRSTRRPPLHSST